MRDGQCTGTNGFADGLGFADDLGFAARLDLSAWVGFDLLGPPPGFSRGEDTRSRVDTGDIHRGHEGRRAGLGFEDDLEKAGRRKKNQHLSSCLKIIYLFYLESKYTAKEPQIHKIPPMAISLMAFHRTCRVHQRIVPRFVKMDGDVLRPADIDVSIAAARRVERARYILP
eukprot:18175-Amorphochlora_amoeboformis.AAC.3